jgi:hypothetical protein
MVTAGSCFACVSSPEASAGLSSIGGRGALPSLGAMAAGSERAYEACFVAGSTWAWAEHASAGWSPPRCSGPQPCPVTPGSLTDDQWADTCADRS